MSVVQEVVVQEDELTLLRGFAHLVSVTYGVRMKLEALKVQMKSDPELIKIRQSLSEKRAQIRGENLIAIIQRGDVESYKKITAEIKDLEKAERVAKKPWDNMINPFKTAVKILDGHIITSLNALGLPPSPQDPPEWVLKEIEKKANKRKKKLTPESQN